jgi:probable O-glycosylation ligase (exosortase A-associated)
MPAAITRGGQIAVATGASLLAAAAAVALPNPAVIAAVGIVPIALVIAFRSPFLLCLAFILFSFFRLHEAFPQLNPLHIPQMLAIGTLTVLAAHLVFRRIEIAWTPELRLFAIFFALITIGVLAATGRDLAIAYWSDTFVKIGIMVFAIASLARRPADFAMASWSIVCAGILVALVALYNSSHEIGLVEGTRVTIGRDMGSVLGDPNDLSLVLAFPMSFAGALLLTPRTAFLARLLGLVGIVVIAMAVLATQSRGGLLGMVAVFAIFGMQKIKSKSLLIAITVVGVLGLFAMAGISGRKSGGAAEAGVIDESSEGRLHAWEAAINMAVHRPLTGVGLNNYVANYYYYSDWWEGFAKAVHSTWFSVLAEGGFLSFGVFVTMIVRVARTAFRSVRALSPATTGDLYNPAAFGMAQSVLAGIAGFVVSGTFLTQGFTWPVYILLALCVAVSRYAQRQAASPVPGLAPGPGI